MKRLALVAALLSAGCDDPAVQERVQSVLDHGAVQAELHCETLLDGFCGPSSHWTQVDCHLFQDGSSFLKVAGPFGVMFSFNSFGQPIQASMSEHQSNSNGQFVIDDGDLYWESACGGGTPDSGSEPLVSCTGFNLEAFGIEE